MAFAAWLMAMTPAILADVLAQRRVMSGLTQDRDMTGRPASPSATAAAPLDSTR